MGRGQGHVTYFLNCFWQIGLGKYYTTDDE